MHVRINVHVLENDAASGERQGTFVEPHPKVIILPGDSVSWHVINQGAVFRIVFSGFASPFVNGERSISDEAPRVLDLLGLYHYAVQVKTARGLTYQIKDCPQLEVGPHGPGEGRPGGSGAGKPRA
jgi:hypothetical protein